MSDSSTASSTCSPDDAFLIHLALVSGPAIALLYSLLVWGCYAFYKESRWSDKLNILGLRMAFLVAAVACSMKIASCPEDEAKQMSTNMVMMNAVSLWMMSLYFMKSTRSRDVVGFTQKPFYDLRGSSTASKQRSCIVITGANNGIGKETTAQLAKMGADKIFMLCRSEVRAIRARNEILLDANKKETISAMEAVSAASTVVENADPAVVTVSQLEIIPMDLGNYASVRQAVDKLEQRCNEENLKVSVLINNAGVMMGTQTKSVDGHDLMMQANHLGHFLLTNLMIEKDMFISDKVKPTATATTKATKGKKNKNKKGKKDNSDDKDESTETDTTNENVVATNTYVKPRIITVTSSTHEFCAGIDFDDFHCTKTRPYTLFGQYGMTKLANILFVKELCRKYPDLALSYAVHPGIVRTNVVSNMQWYMRVLNKTFAYFVAAMQKTPEEGAYGQVLVAAAPEEELLQRLPINGSYVSNGQPYPSSKASESEEAAKRLWELSEKLVGLVKEDDKKGEDNGYAAEEKKEN